MDKPTNRATENCKKFTTFNIASIMYDVTDGEPSPVKKRRRILWPRNRTDNNPPGHVLTPYDEKPRLPESRREKEPPISLPEDHAPIEREEEYKLRKERFTVLNIPMPATNRDKLSKIDLAVLKRQARRMRSVKVESGDSSTESDTEEVDLSIKAGPPCKLELTEGKAEFLNRFGLVTHSTRNCIELRKMMRKKWLAPDVVQENSDQRLRCLDLPVPSKSFLGTNSMRNHKHKRNFLQLLGLAAISAKDKEETEETWKVVVLDRIKRNCETPLTKYYQKSYATLEVAPKVGEASLLPIVHQYKRQLFDSGHRGSKIETCASPPRMELLSLLHTHLHKKMSTVRYQAMKNVSPPVNPGTRNDPENRLRLLEDSKVSVPNKNVNCLPLTRIIMNDNACDKKEADKSNLGNYKENLGVVREHRFKWPGLLEIREAYVRYAKDKSVEIAELRKQRFTLANDNLNLQNMVRFLERKQRSLHSTLFRTNREMKKSQTIIDQLTKILNSFR